MQKIKLDLKENSYDVFIDSGYFNDIPTMINDSFSYHKVTIITDDHVSELYLEQIKKEFSKLNVICSEYIIPHGETSKSIEMLTNIYSHLIEHNMTRTDAIIALGGGVVGDLAGFAAATYLRGIDFIQIPTTLLSQVDSSVGGKVAVNLPQGKNLVGNFYHPSAVYIDTEVLNTLEKREFISGMAEVIKYASIKDKSLFDILISHDLDSIYSVIEEIIVKCVQTKADIVMKDEKESYERMLLNYGHTVGHAIEKYYDYQKYNHGEAVGQGMLYMLKASLKAALIDKHTYDSLVELLGVYGLLFEETYPLDILMTYIKNDKKSVKDKINIVLIKTIGESYIEKVTYDYLEKFLMEGLC